MQPGCAEEQAGGACVVVGGLLPAVVAHLEVLFESVGPGVVAQRP